VGPFRGLPAWAGAGAWPGGAGAWAWVGLPLAGMGGAAGALLVRSPAPPASGRPHPAWGLMYFQYTAFHAGTAALFAAIG
jgi:hypothetical protein